MKLSIIIPAYNEEQRIGRFLDGYLPYFVERYGNLVEFLVIINGTTDDTQTVVESYQKGYPQLQVHVEPNPIGKGGAVIKGIEVSRGEWISYVDADGSTPPEAFLDLVVRATDAPAVIVSSWCSGAVVSPRQPFVRRLASRVFNRMKRLLFGLRLTDTQCGTKVFRRDVVESVCDKIGITKWAFAVDLLFQIRLACFPIVKDAYGRSLGRCWCRERGIFFARRSLGGGVERVAYVLGAAAYSCVFWLFLSNLLTKTAPNQKGGTRV